MQNIRSAFRFVTVAMLSVLLSCNDEPSDLGSDFFEGGSFDLTLIDTISIKVSTMSFDSIVTSGTDRLLVGFHEDNDLGKVYSTTYFQLIPNQLAEISETSSTYLRTELVLQFDGYSYYDTLAQITLNVHKVSEEIKLNSGALYNTTAFLYETQPIGTETILPRPNSLDSTKIPVSDELGYDIFQRVQQSDESVSSSASFLRYLRGLAVVPGYAESGPFVGFTSNPELRIYYLDRSETPIVERFLSFTAQGRLNYNRIQSDRDLTKLKSLSARKVKIESFKTDRIGYMQGGTAIGMRVEFPYLKDILLENKNLIILNAILRLVPVKTLEKNTVARPTLAAYIIDEENNIISNSINKPSLIEDVYLGRDTRYEVDIASFINQQLSFQEFNQNAVLFTIDQDLFQSSINRLYIGDQQNDYQMTLTLYCLKVRK